MDKTALFFNSLEHRFGKENDLSDITWAMCQASPSFKEKWIVIKRIFLTMLVNTLV